MSRVEATKNRWLIALSAIAIHLSIGSIYAYSVFQNPLNESVGWEIGDVTLAFTIAIFFLGLAAAFLGTFVDEYGPRVAGLASAAVFGTGMLGAGFAVQVESLALFLGTYGVIGGIGLGIGYIAPISTLVEWFPDRRGLATGMAVMGFGAGALITSPVAEFLMGNVTSVAGTFYILGIGYIIFIGAGASYMKKPPEGWYPEDMEEADLPDDDHPEGGDGGDLANMEATAALRTKRFYLLWLIIFINISAGIMLLAVAANMTETLTGTTAATAATVVGVMGVFNGLGRIGWASASDYTGRTNMYTAFFAIQIVAFFLLPLTTNVVLFAILLCVIISCYGGGFACLPAYIGDLFGTKELGTIHGYTLTAWSMAGVAGPSLVAYIVSATGSYTLSFYIVNVALIVGLVCTVVLRINIRNVQDSKQEGAAASSTD